MHTYIHDRLVTNNLTISISWGCQSGRCDIFGRKFTSRTLVLDVLEFRPADQPEKYLSGQSAKGSSRMTLSVPSYTKRFSSSIASVAWHGKILRKRFSEAEEITSCNTINHLFVSCPVVQIFWQSFSRWWNVQNDDFLVLN